MLFFCSLHPEWDYYGASQDQCGTISEFLETIATTHYRKTIHCFEYLESKGIILGNGAFMTFLLQSDPEEQMEPLDTRWLSAVTETVMENMDVPIWYGLNMGGKTYILVCFPRLTEDSCSVTEITLRMENSAAQIQRAMSVRYPRFRLIVSDIQYGEPGVFRTFNDLTHALDYFDFRTAHSSPILLNSELQLHGALISDLSVYRKLSVQIAEQLARNPFSAKEVADQICDVLMENSVPSMESVHYHIQLFMLTFTDYLGSAGLVDAAYMERNHIVYRAMAFEREIELRNNMALILDDLHRQNRTLRTIGRQKRIQSIRDYVETHISDPSLTVGQITDLFHVSSAQLAKQFRYYYGLSLHRFIQQSRFQKAETLLREHPEWSTRQVAQSAGYSDLATMYRAFRTFGDITPGALRDAIRQTDILSDGNPTQEEDH